MQKDSRIPEAKGKEIKFDNRFLDVDERMHEQQEWDAEQAEIYAEQMSYFY